MGKTYYSLAKDTNAAGESQIHMRIYVTRESRFRVGTGIWVDRKRWGKKNEINIPNVPCDERDELLAKKATLRAITEAIEREVAQTSDKDAVTREWGEKFVRGCFNFR